MSPDNRPTCLIYAGHFSELALRFAQEMNRHYRVSVILNRKNYDQECGGMFEHLTAGLQVDFVRGGGLRAILPVFLRRLLWDRPQIVQIEETTERWLALMLRIARMFSTVVLRVHDVAPHTGRDSSMSQRLLRERTWNRQHADLVMVHGEDCRSGFAAQYATPVVSTVHGVIGIPKEGIALPGQPGQILMFGRMEEYKGLDVLLAAVGLLESRGLSPQVMIAGRGPEIERHRDTIASLSGVRVHSDFLTPREVIDTFARCEIVVVPYKNATQSGVVAAGIGNERVVVASCVGGIPDVIEHGRNGLLVPPCDAVALADALSSVLTDRALSESLRGEARKSAQNALSWRRIADDMAGHWARAASYRKGVIR